MRDLYTEVFKTLLKEIKDLNKWKDTSCSWIGKLNIVKVVKVYRFNTVATKIPTAFLCVS